MKVTAIIENKSRNDKLIAQYGLSLFVQTNGNGFILDSGYDDSAKKNFDALGFTAADIGAIVISHNHYDHIGGLKYFADAATQTNIYLSESALDKLYTKKWYKLKKLVSRDKDINDNIDRCVFVKDIEKVFDNVFICRIKNPDSYFQCKDKKLKKRVGNKLIADDFLHEVYIAVLENERITIFSSCSHNGIVNIINDAKARFDYPVYAFVGGLHLKGNSKKELCCTEKFVEEISKAVGDLGVKQLYTCHCTGSRAFEIIKENSRLNCKYISTGDSFEI